MRHEFKIEVVSRNGAVHVAVAGELDLSTARLLEDRLRDDAARAEGTLVIDLTEVSFIDSTGLRVLLAAHARAQEAGTGLLIAGAGEQALRLFELAGVADRLPFAAGSGGTPG